MKIAAEPSMSSAGFIEGRGHGTVSKGTKASNIHTQAPGNPGPEPTSNIPILCSGGVDYASMYCDTSYLYCDKVIVIRVC